VKVTVKLLKPWKAYAAGSIVEVDEATCKTLTEAEVAIVWTAADNARVEEQANLVKSAVDAAVKGLKPQTTSTETAENPSGCKSLGQFMKGAQKGNLKSPCSASGQSEAVDEDGGYLVDQMFSRTLIERQMSEMVLATNCQRIPIGPGFSGIKYNGLLDYDRRDGSHSVNVYWTGEACAKTESKAKFERRSLDLEKLAAILYCTDELLQDAIALETMTGLWFGREFAYATDYAVLRGSGTGQPLGILNSAALVEVQRGTANRILAADIANMYARMFPPSIGKSEWFISSSALPQLMQLTIGTQPIWLPGGTLASAPYGTLLGRPIRVLECASSLGTVGDILLADMSQYLMITKGGVKADSSIHVRYIYDETCFRFVERLNGHCLWSRAIYPNQGALEVSPFIVLSGATPTPTPTI
jgi:HK97 family phage major capsid protein